MKKALGMVFLYCLSIAHADDTDKIVITCPQVMACSPSDGPKKNKNYAKINQNAYECYTNAGETKLAQNAATAATKCMAIYGSTTATILSDKEDSSQAK